MTPVADSTAKAALFDGFARVARALGNGRRAEIVDVLGQGERSVEEIAGEIHQSVANTSAHLQQLLRAGLLRSRRDGNRVRYSLASPAVARLWRELREVAAGHLAELDRLAAAYLGDRSQLRTLSRDEVVARLRSGDIVLVDVRPSAEYRAGHVEGARSLPLADLRRRMRDLPRDREVVAYCRGPYCVYADETVRTLTAEGFMAARLEEGFPEWRDAHLPVASGEDRGG